MTGFVLDYEAWRVKFGIKSQKDFDQHLKEHDELLKLNHSKYKGMPAVLERPVPNRSINGLLSVFYTLMASDDFSIFALSKMYDLAGVFSELDFYEIMLDAKTALDSKRAENGSGNRI